MLPKNLNYQNKVNSAPAKSYKSNIQPQNGTSYPDLGAGSSNILYFNIPTRNNLTLDTLNSILRFDYRYNNKSGTNTASVAWDKAGAHGIIQRIRVYHGSNLLEDIDNYGNYVKMLYDLQLDYGSMMSKFNITAGTSALASNVPPIMAGELQSTAAIAINSSSSWRTYCLNLVSIMGTLSDKYYPLFECTSAPLRLEVWLVDNITKAVVSSSATASADTYSLQNVEFICSMVEVSDDAVSIIRGASGGTLSYVINGWRNYGWTSPTLTSGTTTDINMPISAKFSSLKGLFCTFRARGTGGATYFPFDSTTLGTFNSYYFRVGSLIMPPKYPYSLPEAYCELMKGIQPLGDISSSPQLSLAAYSAQVLAPVTNLSGVSTNSSGSFYIGNDFENYPSSEKGNFYSGYNTNTDDIFLVYTLTPSYTGTARIDTYAHYDALINFQGNTCYVSV